MVFHGDWHAPELTVSEEGTFVTVTKYVNRYLRVAADRRLTKGEHYWEVTLFNNPSGNMMLGTFLHY